MFFLAEVFLLYRIMVLTRLKYPFSILIILVICLSASAQVVPKVAFILPLSGKYSRTGMEMKTSIEIALATLKKKSASLAFETLFYDNCSDPDSAGELGSKLREKNEVVMWAGGFPSNCSAVIARLADEAGIPYLVISSSKDTLTKSGYKYVFRIAPPSNDYNDGLVGWAIAVTQGDLPTAVLFEQDSTWQPALDDLHEDLESKWKGEIRYFNFPENLTDFPGLIGRLEIFKPQIIWIIGSSEKTSDFFRYCNEAQWIPSAFLLGTVGQSDSRFIDQVGKNADLVFGPGIWEHTFNYPGVEEFNYHFRRETGMFPDYHCAEAYAAVEVIYNMFSEDSFSERVSLAEALESIDIMTIFGRVRFEDFQDYTNQNRPMTIVLQVQDSVWRVVWPMQLGEVNYVYPVPEWRDRRKEAISRNYGNIMALLMFIITALLLYSSTKKRRELAKRINR